MKKLVILLVVAALGIVVVRRLTASPPARVRQHGTPDHWPPVARKPDTETAPAA